MDNWFNLPIVGQAAWPTDDFVLLFENIELLLKPARKDTEQSIHVNLKTCSKEDALTIINRFLSILSWCEHVPMRIWWEGGAFSGSATPVPIFRSTSRDVGSCICNYPFYRNLDQDPKVRLALALYREALISTSVPLAYLGYFKILNIRWNDKKINGKNELVEGIRSILHRISDSSVVCEINRLKSHTTDIASYLYKHGRCAIAHAYSSPIVDPDEWHDHLRIAKDVTIVRALAEYVIRDMGVSESILG